MQFTIHSCVWQKFLTCVPRGLYLLACPAGSAPHTASLMLMQGLLCQRGLRRARARAWLLLMPR